MSSARIDVFLMCVLTMLVMHVIVVVSQFFVNMHMLVEFRHVEPRA